MANTGASLAARLAVTALGNDRFEATLTDDNGEGRTFGGELLARAATSAIASCDGRTLHSLHAYFLKAGRINEPMSFTVERLRDGRTLASRRVRVEQAGEPICEAMFSFAVPEEGEEYQDEQPDAPRPDKLLDERELARVQGLAEGAIDRSPLEFRHVDVPWRAPDPSKPPVWRAWVRPRTRLPDDPAVQAAALVYLSDHGSLGAIQQRTGERFIWDRSASLDEALWLHRPPCFDGWLLVVSESRTAAGARALTRRRIYTPDGTHVATMAQEALFRLAE